jgi:geranylgeranyl diphosphate synthase type II
MIRLKTAVLFGASLKIGALIGGASEEDAENLYDFGLNIGMGFQLKDDLLDTFGDEDLFGKKTGGDILTNKKTFLYLSALEKADDIQKKRLLKLYNQEPEDADKKIAEVKQIFTELNVYEATDKEIDKYWEDGLQSLEKIHISDSQKEILLDVAYKMIVREK